MKALRPIIFDEKVESVSVLSVCQSSEKTAYDPEA